MCNTERKEFIERGKRLHAKYVIVVCDTFSHEDYPVYVMEREKLNETRSKYNGQNMQRVHEVIQL